LLLFCAPAVMMCTVAAIIRMDVKCPAIRNGKQHHQQGVHLVWHVTDYEIELPVSITA
jgi:hypothetical protein